ncbi:fibronectin type III domain-containing protein [Chryseobacterium sp. 2R14A]|uniref:fibronectin type III domain-containing protein n=1 Tax=Chryseobacterium sp. 2R14A TaxID=3380353 RepID=UPI003CF456A4
MKRNQPALLLGVLGILTSSLAIAQNFQTMPIQSGLNADVIANGVGSATTSTTTDVDGVSYSFVSQDFLATATSPALTYGLPINGIVNSVVTSTPGLSYVLANYSSSNSLKLSTQNATGTIAFTTPKAAFRLYMLATSGSGASTVSVVVNFTDNTSQTVTGVTVADWYDAAGFAIQGFGRINRDTNALESGNGTNPRLYQSLITIDPANQAKPIQSVTITKTSTAQGHTNVFAFSVDAYSTCAAPTLNAVGTVTNNSAAVSWTPATGTTATSYEIYYNTTNTAPTSTTAPILTSIAGTSTTIPSLNANTTYYYWVRANCGGATSQSTWSFLGTFKTACGAVASMIENFDSYNTGTTLPDCWGRLVGSTGSLSISATTPASGTRNIYQYSTASQSTSVAVLPEFSNVNAGTHWLRFKAKVSTTPGTLNVGYVTNPTDASTFTLIQALNITNVNYGPEYFVAVPTSIPATARLAIRNTADGKSYYYDDVKWEAIPSCVHPSNIATSNATANTVDVTWTAPSTGAASGYEYYYSPVSTVTPTSTTAPSGTFAANTVSGTISGLNPNHTYNLWLRSVCNTTSKSDWTYQVAFKTTCAPTPSLFEDLESYGSSVSIVPDCWARIITTNGTQQISSSTPASGIRNLYQYSSSSQNPTIVVLPEFTNINAGTHRLKIKARVSSATGSLIVGYVTSPTDATTFVNIETLSITNTSYASGAEYTVDVPNTVPANARLAVKNTSDAKSYYWDDVTWESKNSLSTSEAPAKKKLTLYPNPFNNVLFISETENVKTVKVNDVAGRTLKVIENPTKEINLSSLNSGLYLITLYFKDGSQNTVKAIKK